MVFNEAKDKCSNILDRDMCIPSFASDSGDSLISANPIDFLSRVIRPIINKDREFTIGRSHGDLHTQNILKDSDRIVWIVDWRHFTTIGHLVMDFSRIQAEILACIDFSESDAIQFARNAPNLINRVKLEAIDNGDYSIATLKALHACEEIWNSYLDALRECNISYESERLIGEFDLGLFLNLVSAASRKKASKIGREVCIYFAGLLTENLNKYIRMTF